MPKYTPVELNAKKAEFAQSAMTLVHMNGISEHYFVNMDETVVYFDSNYNCFVTERQAKTALVRRGSTANKRETACVTFVADGIKLPVPVVFKGTANGHIANELRYIITDGMYDYTQEKGWVDNRVVEIRKEKNTRRTWNIHKIVLFFWARWNPK